MDERGADGAPIEIRIRACHVGQHSLPERRDLTSALGQLGSRAKPQRRLSDTGLNGLQSQPYEQTRAEQSKDYGPPTGKESGLEKKPKRKYEQGVHEGSANMVSKPALAPFLRVSVAMTMIVGPGIEATEKPMAKAR